MRNNAEGRPLSRRTLLLSTLAVSAGGMAGLTGCAGKTLAQTTSLKDKRVKTPDSYDAATADEPKFVVKILATPTFKGVIPALLDQYSVDHANLHFAEPTFKEGGQLLEALQEGAFDMVFSDVEAPLTQGLEQGLIDEGTRTFLWTSGLNVVSGSSSTLSVKNGSDLEKQEIATIALCDDANSISALFARQFLASCGLYSDATGEDGSFSDTIGGKIRILPTATELAAFLEENPHAVGFLMEPELLLQQALVSQYEVPRVKYRVVSYQGAVLKSATQMAASIALLQWCDQNTRAFRAIEAYGFRNE